MNFKPTTYAPLDYLKETNSNILTQPQDIAQKIWHSQ